MHVRSYYMIVSLAEDILSNHQQTVTFNNYKFPLILLEKETRWLKIYTLRPYTTSRRFKKKSVRVLSRFELAVVLESLCM
jgi:hypothetical protein